MALDAQGGTITYTIKVDPSGAVVGIKNAESKMTSAAANSGTKSGNALSKAWSVTTGAIAGVTSQVFSKVTSVISSSVSTAVKRVDTLNNFPKVMSNLGIGADEASASIQKMSDKLLGLPTSLDEGAAAVQRFTSKNGDVAKSTDLFLALNNAILAGGAPAEQQSTALEQLSQAYAKGKPDMMEWRSAMTAMPAQLKQVATAMGFVNADALGEALRKGEVSMDDFMDSIMKLNTEGIDGLANFEEQARNATGGIGTTITNLKNRIAQGLGDMIQAIGSENIASAVDGIGNAFKEIGKAIGGVINFVKENKDWLAPLVLGVASFAASLLVISKAIVVVKGAFTAITTVINAYQAGLKLATAVQTAFNLAMDANPIMLVISAIIAVVAALIWFFTQTEAGKAVLETLGQVIGAVFNAIGEFFGAIGKWIGDVFNLIGEIASWIWNNVLQPIINFYVAFYTTIWNAIVGFVSGVIEVVSTIVTWVWENILQPIINFIVGFCQVVWQVISGIIIAIIAILATIAQWVWENVLQPIINFYVGLWTTIINALITAWNTIVAFLSTIAQWVWNNVLLPIINFATSLWNTIVSIVSAIWDGIVAVFSAVAGWVWDNIISPIINFATDLWNTITGIVSGIWNTITGVIGSVASWIYDNVISPIGRFFEGLWNGIKSGVEGLIEGIKTAFGVVAGIVKAPINGIISGINGVIDGINSIEVPDWVPVIGGASANIPHIPALATGGIVESTVGGRIIRAGEGGEDEWVVPESKMASLIEKLENDMGGNDAPIMNFNFNGVVGTPSEMREYATRFHDAYEDVQKRRIS